MNARGRHRFVQTRASRATALAALAAAGSLLVGACGVDGTPVSDGSTSTPDTSSQPTTAPESPSSTTPGAPVMAGGAFRVTSAAGQPKVLITVIEDLACPACKNFESVVGSTLDGYGDDTEVAIDYRVISFLDRASPDRYSSRAANASYCVWHAGDGTVASQKAWREFQRTMFEKQPDEGGPGLDDDEITAIATESGISDVGSCITSGQYADDVTETTDETMNDSEFEGTPTVLVNGEKVTVSSADDVKDAVDAARR